MQEISALDDFMVFLNERADLLETLELKDKSNNKLKQMHRSKVKAFLV